MVWCKNLIRNVLANYWRIIVFELCPFDVFFRETSFCAFCNRFKLYIRSICNWLFRLISKLIVWLHEGAELMIKLPFLWQWTSQLDWSVGAYPCTGESGITTWMRFLRLLEWLQTHNNQGNRKHGAKIWSNSMLSSLRAISDVLLLLFFVQNNDKNCIKNTTWVTPRLLRWFALQTYIVNWTISLH